MARTVVIIVAPQSQRPVLAALTDLSASGLLSPFVWIEAPADPEHAPDHDDPVTVEVERGIARPSTFSAAVNRHGLERERLLAVVPVGHPADDALSGPAEQFYRLRGLPSGTRQDCLRLLIPWSKEPVEAQLGRNGWEDVMISPESTADPAFSQVPWWNDTASIPGAAAVAIAVHSGLVGAVTRGPYDNTPTDVSTAVSVVRSFARITDARAVEDDLRRQVLTVTGTLPRPTRSLGGATVDAYTDPEARVAWLSQVWGKRHAASLRRPAASVAGTDERTEGFLDALRLFFSFMFKALLGAPAAWARSVVHGVKTSVALTTATVVFGPDSPVHVIVGGVDQSGVSVGWRQLRQAALQASNTMPPEIPSSPVQVRRSFTDLWRDLRDGAIGLAQGSGCESLTLPAYAGVVTDTSLIAPPLDAEGSFLFREAVGPIPAGTRLMGWDQLEIRRVQAELTALARSNDPRAAAAGRVLAEIEAWQGRNGQRLLPQIGNGLATIFEQTRRDIVAMAEQVRALQPDDTLAGIESRQRRLRTILLVLAILMLVGIGALVVGGVTAAITWTVVGIVATIVVVLWLLVSLVTFWTQQRELFRLRYHAKTLDTVLLTVLANLRTAIEDLAAQGEAYDQFIQWGSILTSFFSDPLGERATEQTARDHVTRFPAGFQRVVADADQQHLANVAAALRMQVFSVGWLSEAWNAFEEGMDTHLTPDQRQRRLTRELDITAETGRADSALSRWAEGLRHEGVTSQAGADRWQRCLALLQEPTGPHLELMITMPDGQRRTLKDYRSDLEHAARHSVVQDMLRARVRTSTSVLTSQEHSWFHQEDDGLSQTMVLLAATPPIAADDFIYPEPGLFPLDHGNVVF